MRNVFVIGAGEMGSRHLQALKAVKDPLRITVIDPSTVSLQTARERFESMGKKNHPHTLCFVTTFPVSEETIDIAIIATTSAHRRQAIETLLSKHKVKFFILEKLLFQKKEDFYAVDKMLKKSGATAFVNCMMRSIPFYRNLKTKTPLQNVSYTVTSGETGLVTSAVHFLDHLAFLTGCFDYTLDTSLLDPKPIESKRRRFLELTGTITARFKNGSVATLTRYPDIAPTIISILSPDLFATTNFPIGKAFKIGQSHVSRRSEGWESIETTEVMPYQSVMTTGIVENILKNGKSVLATYEEAVKIHLPLLETLRLFLEKKSGKKKGVYPFT